MTGQPARPRNHSTASDVQGRGTSPAQGFANLLELMRNLTLAFRTLLKTPFVTAVAAGSLALGIGSNTAIFSIYDEMLRRPLPVHRPERLVNISAPGVMNGSTSCNQSGDCDRIWSYPMFRDLEQKPALFSGIAGHRALGVNIAVQGQTPVTGLGSMVSGQYFPVLGIQPALGRLLGPADDQTIGAHPVAVLSYRFWENTLGSDPSIVDKTILVNGYPMTVVGVAPRGFDGTTLGNRVAVFVPMTMRARMNPGWQGFENRRSYWVYAFARLRDGVAVEQGTAAINAVYRPILLDVEVPLHEGLSEQTMARFQAKKVVAEDGRRGQSQLHEEATTPIVLLLSVTGIVLLIACANIANLLLARGANRATEMAVRLSLGATRGQLLTQLLSESVMLAMLGGVLSLVTAYWTLTGITALLPAEVTATMDFRLSGIAVVFAFAMSAVTGALFGLFPALQSTRPDLVTAIRNNSGRLSGGRAAARFRGAMVTTQMALSMALLTMAGLFIKSLANVSRVDLGLDIEPIVTFSVVPVRNGYDSTASQALYARIEEELAAVPGVTNVAAAMVPLLAGSWWGEDVRVQGFEDGPDVDDNSAFNYIGPGYFKTFGVRLLRGREFAIADALGRANVAIVNEAFARKFGLDREAVGKFMATEDTGPVDIEIVGLVEDAKYSDVKDRIPPQFFRPYRQLGNVAGLTFYAKTAGDPIQLVRSIPAFMRRIDANLPVEELRTMPQQVRDNTFLDRMISILSASFSLVATLLAAVGLYGVLAYSVAQRTREIGVRMALGASGGAVRGMVLRQVALLTALGGAIGLATAVALGRVVKANMASLLFELESHDVWVMGGAVVLLALVALGAGYLPALRASQVDPMDALRYE